jgi:hypothetical protein
VASSIRHSFQSDGWLSFHQEMLERFCVTSDIWTSKAESMFSGSSYSNGLQLMEGKSIHLSNSCGKLVGESPFQPPILELSPERVHQIIPAVIKKWLPFAIDSRYQEEQKREDHRLSNVATGPIRKS